MQRISIPIAGMSCGGCVANVRKALTQLPGVQVEDVKVGVATVSFDPALTSREALGAAIAGAGYQPKAA
ncbi:MAG: heavy-metal-associated domain-containing protein [Gemmatimonadota bacterium]